MHRCQHSFKKIPSNLWVVWVGYISFQEISYSGKPQVVSSYILSNLWSYEYKCVLFRWKGINRKQSTRWQHLSQLKASAFFSLQKNLVVMKHSNLYLGLELPSGGWQSLIISSMKTIKLFDKTPLNSYEYKMCFIKKFYRFCQRNNWNMTKVN